MPDSNFQINRLQLIEDALGDLGQRNPSTDEMNRAVRRLNNLIKMIDATTKLQWTQSNTESTITLSSGTRTYTTGSGAANIPLYMRALATFSLFTNNTYEPLDIYTKRESVETWLREGTGKPVAVFLEVLPNPANNVLHVFQTPNSTYTGKFTYWRRHYDMDLAADNPDFPAEWNECLGFGLKWLLGPQYGLAQDEALGNKAQFDLLKKELQGSNESKRPKGSRPVKIKDF